MKKVTEHLEKNDPERLNDFKAIVSAQVKKILSSFDDWDFVHW